MKKLYRSRNEKVFAGILGGVGEYANVDPTVLRVVLVVALILTGFFPLAIAYVIAIFLMPVRPSGKNAPTLLTATPNKNSPRCADCFILVIVLCGVSFCFCHMDRSVWMLGWSVDRVEF